MLSNTPTNIRLLTACILFFVFSDTVTAQKKILTYTDYKDWDNSISAAAMSSDGKFFSYGIKDSVYIESTDGKTKRSFYSVGNRTDKNPFSSDGKWFLFRRPGDSLGIVKTDSDSVRYIANVALYDFSRPANCLVYTTRPARELAAKLVLLNLSTGTERNLGNIIQANVSHTDLQSFLNFQLSFQLSENESALAWIEAVDIKTKRIHWMNLTDQVAYDIGTAGKNIKFQFNKEGNRLVISSKDSSERGWHQSVKFFSAGMESAKEIDIDDNGSFKGYSIDESRMPVFSRDGHHLYFILKKDMSPAVSPGNSSGSSRPSTVQIFGNGGVLYNNLVGKSLVPRMLVTVDLDSPSVPVILSQKKQGDTRDISIRADIENGEYVLASEDVIMDRDIFYKSDSAYRPNIYLVSCKTGARCVLIRRAAISQPVISPAGKYISWYDKIQQQWMIYNIGSGKAIAVSRRIPEPIFDKSYDYPGFPEPESSLNWQPDDQSVLIASHYDLWLVDPEDRKAPVNITQGYGKAHHIQFRCLKESRDFKPANDKNGVLLLSAFNEDTKDAGYFKLDIPAGKLDRVILSSHKYSNLVKAEAADMYLFTRERATEHPNYYATTDFRNIVQLTFINPEKNYNWYTTELVKWKMPDGKMNEGVLYKPENFDSTKKYPVIFYYYQRNVYGPGTLNTYVNPILVDGTVDRCLPWYLSNGYLFFFPSIHYKVNYPGRSACDAVVSGARRLSQFSWVDSKHMGIQGHSFGGFETNYIVSHSNLFAAAAPAAGVSNAIESYGDTYGWYFYEGGQGRIAATLWQRPDLYMDNSAVLHADKVTTPLLIIHGKHDNTVPYNHAWQWYQDLQRLNKKVWLLSYDEDHEISETANKVDCTIRMQQFFDYYLKGLPPAVWMTHPLITPDMIKSGEDLKLDTSGVKP